MIEGIDYCINGNMAILLREYTHRTGLRIPKGYDCDGASVPKVFHRLIGYPLDNEFIEASFIHDWIYWTHCRSREIADWLFHRTLRDNGVPKVKAYVMYKAVRVFGDKYWDNTVVDIVEMLNFMVTVQDIDRYDFGKLRTDWRGYGRC